MSVIKEKEKELQGAVNEDKGEKDKPTRKKRLQYKIDQFGVVLEVKEVD